MPDDVMSMYVLPALLGLGLASCAGLRAWLPMLLITLLSQLGYFSLEPSFAFLGSTEALVLFSIATLIEVVGDKFPVVDHFLDAVGVLLRPACGTVLASCCFKMEPLVAVALGAAVGGSSAFVVNSGKALGRTWMTGMVPAHGGLGNAVLSFVEDVFSLIGVCLSLLAPWLAALIAIFLLWCSIKLVSMFLQQGGRLISWLLGRVSDHDVKEIPGVVLE